MDNDTFIIKKTKEFLRNLQFRFNYFDIQVISENDGNTKISEMIDAGSAFCVVRAGATEMRCIAEFLKYGRFSEKIKLEIKNLSGVFSNDDNSLKKFCELYIEAMKSSDLISLWGVGAESTVIHKYCMGKTYTKLRALEPYYFEKPWSTSLKNKKVLVVHPFKNSIQLQYDRRNEIFPGKEILPEMKSLICIEAVQSLSAEKSCFKDWFEALDYMKLRIAEIDFDVAIIGAGAYGLPLASYCKLLGKKAIQMSGATQILFGIKGKRWDNHPVISKLYNDSWVRPLTNETPKNSRNVEGGSYW